MSVLACTYGRRGVGSVEVLDSRIVDELVEVVEAIEVRLIQSQRQERCRSRMSSGRPSEASSTRSSTCSKPSGPP